MTLTDAKRLVDHDAGPELDAVSAEWVQALTDTGAAHEAAAARLYDVLLHGARSEVRRRAGQLSLAGPELDDLAHHAAADALLAVTAKVGNFRGESRFTTWAYKFVILEVSAKIGQLWRHPTASMDVEDWQRLPDRFGFDPAEQSESRDLLAAVRSAVETELTPHQRRLFVSLVLDGKPLDALVEELGSNRNAVYKVVFDARRKLRSRLAAQGYLADSMAG